MFSGMSGKAPTTVASVGMAKSSGVNPSGGGDVTGADAAVDVGLGRLVGAGAALGGEPVGVVEGVELGEGHLGDDAGAVRRAIDGEVVVDDEYVVGGQRDVEVEHVDTCRHAVAEGVHRRSRIAILAAGVGEHDRSSESEHLVDRRRRLIERRVRQVAGDESRARTSGTAVTRS